MKVTMDASPKRRIFLKKGEERHQVFSFTQHADGSIYCGSPTFADAKWIAFAMTQQGPAVGVAESLGDGKMSLHGSGMVGVRPHDQPGGHQLAVLGNLLKSGNELRARHLFTVFPSEPNHLPVGSPAFNRDSDYCMESKEELRPFLLAFFAVPAIATKMDFIFSLDTDQLANIPNDFLGMNFFTLRYHHILWFAYRTTHLPEWPKVSHYSYSDGYLFPVFIGTPNSRLTVEIREPRYSLSGNALTIDCSSPDSQHDRTGPIDHR